MRREWWKTRAAWANFARCDHAVLFQVPSTNPVEAWHRALKDRCKDTMPRWSMAGLIEHVHNVACIYEQRAEKAARDFRSCFLSELTQ